MLGNEADFKTAEDSQFKSVQATVFGHIKETFIKVGTVAAIITFGAGAWYAAGKTVVGTASYVADHPHLVAEVSPRPLSPAVRLLIKSSEPPAAALR